MAQPISETNGNHAPLPPGDPESRWVEEAPLKLLAGALRHRMERTGTEVQIRAALHSWVDPEVKWSYWWRQTERMADKSVHFERNGSGSITLLADEISDIPDQPLPLPKAQREWLEWFQGKAKAGYIPTKSGNPVKVTREVLEDICPPKYHGTALRCTMDAVRNVLLTNKRLKAAAKAWAPLLNRAAQLWRNHPDATDNTKTAADAGELMAKLVYAADFPKGCGLWLCQAGGLPAKQPEDWRQGFATGLGKAMLISGYDIPNWIDKAPEDKAAIAQEIALAAFAGGAAPVSQKQFSRLDDLLLLLHDAEKPDAKKPELFFHNLIIRTATGEAPRQNVLDYIARTRNVLTPKAHLDIMVLASLLLTDGSGSVVDQAAQGIGRALAGDDAAGDACSPPWKGLLADGRRRFDDLSAGLTDEMERQRRHYEEQLEECHREGERLNRQAQRVRAQLEAGREASKLDIRQDMLLVMSETLQGLRQSQDSPEHTLRNVAAGLVLALRAGDAEEFGAVGETVPYDPTRHQSDQPVPLNAAVRITYPGAAVRGKLTGDRVILKAQVVLPVEDN